MTISRAEAIRRLSQVLPLERQCEALKTENVCLHTELRHQQDFVSRLKFLLSERLNKIDQLNATIDRLRDSESWMRRMSISSRWCGCREGKNTQDAPAAADC